MESFKAYLERCRPLPWTVTKEHPNEWLVGNHALAVNFVRFGLITEAIQKYAISDSTVLDLGVYPGIVQQLFHEYLTEKKPLNCYGAGLGFDSDFKETMEQFGVTLLECDLEPRLHLDRGRNTAIPLEGETVDLVVFTDVIEHFYDPFYPLQEINRVAKNGAVLLLTTDNLNRFGAMLALLRGRSCNVPLIEGNIFYTGDWRPHFREYSRSELFQLMEWAGFEVLEHQFFEADYGQYRIIDGHLVRKDLRKLSFKEKLADAVRRLSIKVLPHLRDNHILVAKKIKSYEDMLATAPRVVNDMDEWLRQRQAFGS